MNEINKLETDSGILLYVFHCLSDKPFGLQCTKRNVDKTDIFSTLMKQVGQCFFVSWCVVGWSLCILVG